MHAHPGIQREAVGTLPVRVSVDGDKRVPILPAGSYRRDQRVQASIPRGLRHCLDDKPAQAPSLLVDFHLGRKCGHGGWRRLLRDPAQADSVNSGGQVGR
jgi:hypothetical protein